jgi:hypothetical protein
MSSDPTQSERNAQFRQALVATANLGPYLRRRPPLKLVIGSLVVFAVAGALTGGALVTTSKPDPAVVVAQNSAEVTGTILARQSDGTLIGQPFTRTGRGTQQIELGVRPPGATAVVEGFDCIDPGAYVGLLDSKRYEKYPACEPGGSSGTFTPVSGSGEHVLTVQTANTNRFAIWLSWVHIPTWAKSAAQTRELADGTITRDEDVAAVNRYAGCMGALGDSIYVSTDYATPYYAVSDLAYQDGTNTRCYNTEFAAVDEKWQIELETTNIGQRSLDQCLLNEGVTPPATAQQRFVEMQSRDFALTSCPWIG